MIRRGAMVLLAAVAPLACFAYGPQTVKRMVTDTVLLAPAALHSAVGAYRTDLDQGVEDALKQNGRDSADALISILESEAQRIPGLARQQADFSRIAYHFGYAAGLVYLLNDPLIRSADPKVAAIREDYSAYIERKLPLLIISFDGYEHPEMGADLGAYFQARQSSLQRYRDAILFCYYPHGELVSSMTFDNRSNAFGAAQVILSHSVSDAAKLWYRLWKSMDGDLSATPYYHYGKDREQTP